jgi:hypothetical protein
VIKQRTIWEASDGRVFDAEETATVHEEILKDQRRVNKLHDFLLKSVPKKQASMWPMDCALFLYMFTDEVFDFIKKLKEEE